MPNTAFIQIEEFYTFGTFVFIVIIIQFWIIYALFPVLCVMLSLFLSSLLLKRSSDSTFNNSILFFLWSLLIKTHIFVSWSVIKLINIYIFFPSDTVNLVCAYPFSRLTQKLRKFLSSFSFCEMCRKYWCLNLCWPGQAASVPESQGSCWLLGWTERWSLEADIVADLDRQEQNP